MATNWGNGAKAWTNIDLWSIGFHGIPLKTTSLEVLHKSSWKIALFKITATFLGANEVLENGIDMLSCWSDKTV